MDLPKRLNGLDLFSGIGGNTIALRQWIKTITYCDFDRHSQSVLISRMRSGDIEPAPIWDDVSTLKREHFSSPIDIIMGGFPCQDLSLAGKGAGIGRETRSGLFFQVMRLVRELSPTFVFLENVPAIRTRGLNIVLRELTEAGYDCRWTMLSASSVGANHKRERWFLLAYANANKMATPQSRDYRTAEGYRWQDTKNRSRNLNDQVAFVEGYRVKNPDGSITSTVTTGKLNPTFVEWLMNFSIEWSALSDLETVWFRSKRKKRSKS